ncbi:hypothetical protein RA28_09990 [Ruegeria sp. ANG-S4]|nr:hypothetical protein RA28_09990 [Ruegeria sp. ANG-S4]
MPSNKDLLKTLLKGIETGDPGAAAVVNEAKYIQHNPQTHEGSEGLAELFKRLSKTNPRVNFVRVFEDGNFAFAHNEYDFSGLRVAFEVFRFEDGQAVEHWDNIQPMKGPNPSGRGMLDGTTEISDLAGTEINRGMAQRFAEQVLVDGKLDLLDTLVDENLVQHDPDLTDGVSSLRAALEEVHDGAPKIRHDKVHRVLAEGNFALCMCEGRKADVHTSFYHLFRFQDGLIVEHWNTIEAIAPRSEWKNDNGKF